MNPEKINNKNYINAILLIGVIFSQNPPWFIWETYYYFLVFFVFTLITINANRIYNNSRLYAKHLYVAMLAFFFYYVRSLFEQPTVSSFVTVLFFLLMFIINDKEKVLALKILTNVLGVIVFVSLLTWLVNTFIFQLSPFGTITYGEGKGASEGHYLNNYYFFIQPANVFVIRFYSIFDEPGVLGTLSALVLFANKYNFKNLANVVLLIGGIFTFSLAFIIITLVGYIALNTNNALKLLRSIVVLSFIGGVTFLLLKDNETFQLAVLNRFSNIDSAGISSRTSDYLNEFFSEYILSFKSILGMGTSFFSENKGLFLGQGYKFFFIEYGIVGFVILIWMYISMIRPLTKIGLILLFIFLLSFLQRPFMFMPWQIALFSMSVSNLNCLADSMPIKRKTIQIY